MMESPWDWSRVDPGMEIEMPTNSRMDFARIAGGEPYILDLGRFIDENPMAIVPRNDVDETFIPQVDRGSTEGPGLSESHRLHRPDRGPGDRREIPRNPAETQLLAGRRRRSVRPTGLEPAAVDIQQQDGRDGIDPSDAAFAASRATLANFSRTFIHEARTRNWYVAKAEEASADFLARVERGEISAETGGRAASDRRDQLMHAARRMGTAWGRSIAQQIKAKRPDIMDLQLKGAGFTTKKGYDLGNWTSEEKLQRWLSLSKDEQTDAWKEVIEAAGRPDETVTKRIRRLGMFGRALIPVTIALSAYEVLSSDDVIQAMAKESANIGAGIAGGAAGGALAGLICGPAAPVCSSAGVFIGGVAGALGVELGADYLSDLFIEES